MEFGFNLNEIFKNSITKINNNLLPSNFSGDRRNAMRCASLIADVIDTMGIASAKAQSLQHPITSAEKMRNFDHILYLMIEPGDNNGRGSVVGMLKVGVKNLFLFDETGMVHEKKPLCILDFYVHELKQRAGFGKKLYDHMLHDKNVLPQKLAIDKPSEKFLSFLYKHYGLSKIYPQNNNFVLFEGFFNEEVESRISMSSRNQTSSPIHTSCNSSPKYSAPSEGYRPALYGRHAAFRPHDSMGKCVSWRQFGMTHHSALW